MQNIPGWQRLGQRCGHEEFSVDVNHIALSLSAQAFVRSPAGSTRQSTSKPTSMKYLCLFIVCAAACTGNSHQPQVEKAADTTAFVSNDTIPMERAGVSRKAVASYFVPVGDPKLERSFGISIFETRHTFRYLMQMHYEAVQVTDTLKIPNFGTWPVVEVRQGKDKLSCIIGFLDQKKQFKEYKMLTAKGDKMKLVVLRKYDVGRYRTVYR